MLPYTSTFPVTITVLWAVAHFPPIPPPQPEEGDSFTR